MDSGYFFFVRFFKSLLYYFCAPLTSSSPLRPRADGVVDLYPWRLPLVRLFFSSDAFLPLFNLFCVTRFIPRLLLVVVLYILRISPHPPSTYRLGRIGLSSRAATVRAPCCARYPLADDLTFVNLHSGCVSTTHPSPIQSFTHSHAYPHPIAGLHTYKPSFTAATIH
jgi:hypothetical protein